MKKTLIALSALTSIVAAGDMYTGVYLQDTGIVKPHIETGIPSSVDGNTLLKKRVAASLNLYFDGESLSKESKEALDKVMSAHKGAYVALVAHTSSVTLAEDKVGLNGWESFWQMLGGSEGMDREDAIALSNNRLKAVYDYLVSHYTSASKIYNENRLDRDPVSTEATSVGKSLNNRVELLIFK